MRVGAVLAAWSREINGNLCPRLAQFALLPQPQRCWSCSTPAWQLWGWIYPEVKLLRCQGRRRRLQSRERRGGAVTWVLRLMENRPQSEFRAESRSRAWPALLQLRFQRGPGASPDGNSQPHAASLSCCGWMWGRWVLGDPSITVPALLLPPPSGIRTIP